ncbi:hypothetical protein [Deinococcus soli (ex Cha et al. 2016)]|uniref:Uncharacterized protein n=2 Tax=Deinococcus soli (ex Cha et al. 2016) TaxID=1309411 RepID=A0ACC6KGX5_9DEIO|nr:hypothetical protein [Deinococcus soli (ex Cha et al. 2016)]MDR6219021.1 hypothetical protein [Deinococcus soli (ex Cha et al. 2016)]MDR6328818.1 hypothetical protein [Deinococcus soli (ex Cha et al. 2016)]MDR6751694.1 hypothetical protein [Deinococcus soli (ex Cha et al. 2016)]
MTLHQNLPLLPEGYERPAPPQATRASMTPARVQLDAGILPNTEQDLLFNTSDLPAQDRPYLLTARGELHSEDGPVACSGSLTLFALRSDGTHQVHVVMASGLAAILSSLRTVFLPDGQQERHHTVDFELRRGDVGPALLAPGTYRLPRYAVVEVYGDTLTVDVEPWSDLHVRIQDALSTDGIELLLDQPVGPDTPVHVAAERQQGLAGDRAVLWVRPAVDPEAQMQLGQRALHALLRAGLHVAWPLNPELPMLVQ